VCVINQSQTERSDCFPLDSQTGPNGDVGCSLTESVISKTCINTKV